MFELTDSETERIDREALRILTELGVRVDDADLRAQAVKAGATTGLSNERICFPREMVRQYVSQAPSQARFADCDGNITVVGGGEPPTFWTGAALNYVVGTESHAITSADLAQFASVADTLDGVFAVVGTSVADVTPPPARDVVGFSILAANTSKHIRPLLFTASGVKPMLEMAQVIADGDPLTLRPLISFGYSCLSPLHWTQITIDMWRESAGHKLPVMLNAEPVAGASSPVTLAGSIAQSNAEVLGGVVLVQLIEPGRPVVHNIGFAHTMDMRTTACLAGAAECAIMACAGAKLARFYDLPCASWMNTDAFMDDQQASMEKALTGLAHTIGGVDIIWGMGQLAGGKALSAVQLVMDNELVEALRRLRRGLDVNDETLAFDVIADVVRDGADFLGHKHTLENFKAQLSESDLLTRSVREVWERSGAKDLARRAEEYVQQVRTGEAPVHLTDRQLRDIEAIKQRYLKRI